MESTVFYCLDKLINRSLVQISMENKLLLNKISAMKAPLTETFQSTPITPYKNLQFPACILTTSAKRDAFGPKGSDGGELKEECVVQVQAGNW